MRKFLDMCIVWFFIGFLVSPADGGETIRRENWENGNPKLVKITDTDTGDMREVAYYRNDGSLEQHERYDPAGHKVEESYYDEKGKLEVGPDGWSAVRFVYKNGVIRLENYYGDNGKLMERKHYDNQGNLVDKDYIGVPQLPEEEFNPMPPLLGTETASYYDQYGTPEGKTTISRDPDSWWDFYGIDD